MSRRSTAIRAANDALRIQAEIESLLTDHRATVTRLRFDNLFANPAGLTDEEQAMYDDSGMTPERYAQFETFPGWVGSPLTVSNIMANINRHRPKEASHDPDH